MVISQIAAMSQNRVIGVNNHLPWNMPDELAYFFRITRGRHIIMGRKNFEANGRPLPNRVNIVLSTKKRYIAHGCIVVHSIDEAIQYAKGQGEDEAFIVGGGEIYKATLDITERIYLTIIETKIKGDTYFPELNSSNWKVVSKDFQEADLRNKFNYTFYIYERK